MRQGKKFYLNDDDTPWEYIGDTLSAVEDPLHPFDHEVIRAIRRDIDPWFVPLVRKVVYRHNDTDVAWTFHVWARVDEMESPLGVRTIEQRITFPTSPGAVNSSYSQYRHQLIFKQNCGFIGDSERMPGRNFPFAGETGWYWYDGIKKAMYWERRMKQAERARREASAVTNRWAKNEVECGDLLGYVHDENRRRFAGNPLVSVPASIGESAA